MARRGPKPVPEELHVVNLSCGVSRPTVVRLDEMAAELDITRSALIDTILTATMNSPLACEGLKRGVGAIKATHTAVKPYGRPRPVISVAKA